MNTNIDPKAIQAALAKFTTGLDSNVPEGSAEDTALRILTALIESPFITSVVAHLVAAVERHMPDAL